jgi:hypothetical protein
VLMISHGKVVADAKIEDLIAEHNTSLEQIFIKLAVS